MRPRFPLLFADRSFILFVAVSTLALTVLRYLSADDVTRWWIPAFELAVLLRAAYPFRPWSASRTHLMCALGFCLAGDVLINCTPWGDGCIVFFTVTHLNLLWIFVHLRRPSRSELPVLFPGLLASAAVFVAVLPTLSKVWMPPLLGAYLLLLDLMVWRAVALLRSPRPEGGRLLAAGAILFFLTDQFVILQIYRPNSVWVVATWLCYPPALALLALASRFLAGRKA